MKNWKKENATKMKVWYSLDKYRESEQFSESIITVEGYQAYLNTPMAASYVNLQVDDTIICISRELVLKVELYKPPKWTILDEPHVSDAAKMRILNLDNDIEIQKNQFDQEKRMRETKGEEVI